MPEVWTDANPWTDDYLERELRTMQGLVPFDDGRLVLKYQERSFVDGPTMCYLRDDLIDWGPFPWLAEYVTTAIGEEKQSVWMSVTPLEIESHYMPLCLAEGRVGVGGLGLGYFAQRVLTKPNVDEIVVYETNARIIELYLRHFGPHPKLRIVEQDVGLVEGETFDVFYNDVYAKMLEDLTFEHWRTLTERNDINVYHPWGLEAMLFAFVLNDARNDVPFYLRHVYWPFLKGLLESIKDRDHGTLGYWYVPSLESARTDAITLGHDIWPTD